MVWGGEETLIIVSSDLSHYHTYAVAQKMDAATSDAIADLALERIGPQHACGCMPLRGLLAPARDEQMHISVLATINSGDTAGSHERVVGYGAYTLTEQAHCTAHDKAGLLELAWRTLKTGVASGNKLAVNADSFPAALTSARHLRHAA